MRAVKFSKGIVVLCIAVTTLYTMAVLLLCLMQEKLPPMELTTGVFAMYSIELGALAAIKVKEDGDGPSGRHTKED